MQKLDKMIANKIMAMARGNLFVAVMYLFAITAFLSMWMSNTATAAMMLPLAMGILSKLDKEKEHNTYVFVLLGIAYSASIGGMGTLVGSPPNAIVASNLHLTFSDWLWYGLPIMLILMPLMIGTLFMVFKPRLHLHFEQNFERIEMNGQRVLTLVIFWSHCAFVGYLVVILIQSFQVYLVLLKISVVLIASLHYLRLSLFVQRVWQIGNKSKKALTGAY